MRDMERCWARIDLSTVKHNYAEARRICGDHVKVMAVVKANAYGLGIEPVARALMDADFFCVASYDEAERVLSARPDASCLVMGLCGPEELMLAVQKGVRLTVFSRRQAACVLDAAEKAGVRAVVHVKVETGLHRLGFGPEDMDFVADFVRDPRVDFEGLFTHLALRTPQTDQAQFDLYDQWLAHLARLGVRPRIRHMCDSIGMVRYPERHMDAVRVGAWLYGVCPRRCPYPEKCLPTVTFQARVAEIASVPAGECVGYDEDHPLARPSLIATLSSGYADGYPRLNHVGEVLIHGRRAPVVGLVCMDQMMVDVTDIPDAREGDEVTLLGPDLWVNEYSAWGNLNRNECLARLTPRVKRIYVG